MAANLSNLNPRLADRRLFLVAAVGFPLLVLIGYFRSYYGGIFFETPRLTTITHVHGIVMTLWVVYFTVQIALIRTKNVKLHMAMGMVGVALAVLVVVTGTLTAYDANLVRASAPPGTDPRSFFLIPMGDMLLFVIFFAGAIYYRKRPTEHKSLMLMTAINFLPAALFRIPLVPMDYAILKSFGLASLIGVICLAWHSWKHRRINPVFAGSVTLMIAALPIRLAIGETRAWLDFATWLAG